jgi:hypothetical protein
MKILAFLALLGSGFFLFIGTAQAQEAPIHWIVQDGYEANREQAERLYFDAARWVEDRFGSPGEELRPPLHIHVGEPCPDPEVSGACQGSLLGELYIPEWNEDSPGYIVQATILMSLLELMPREDLREATLELLQEDSNNFLDVSTVLKKQ